MGVIPIALCNLCTMCAARCEASHRSSPSEREENLPSSRMPIQKPVYRVVVCGDGDAASAAKSELARIVQESSPSTPYDIRVTQIFSRDLAVTVPAIDLYEKVVRSRHGGALPYDQCILALDRPVAPLLNKMVSKELLSSQGIVRDSRNKSDMEYAMKIIQRGGHVTILGGNNWSNIEAACLLGSTAQQYGYNRSVTLVYPSYGPMAGILPRYLSLLLAGRLISRGVDLVPFSQVRYIDSLDIKDETDAIPSPDISSGSETKSVGYLAATVYLARTYDSINSSSFPTDLILVGPSVVTTDWRDKQFELRILPSQQGLIQALLLTQEIEIDRLLGGIPVNRSLQAAQGLLVAGECANVYHSLSSQISDRSGQSKAGLSYRRTISGEYDARHSARKAAAIALGQERVYDKIPSEVLHSPVVGMSFLAIGLCTASLESHSFWWRQTNIPAKLTGNADRVHHLPTAASVQTPKPIQSDKSKTDLKPLVSGNSSNEETVTETGKKEPRPHSGKYAVWRAAIDDQYTQRVRQQQMNQQALLTAWTGKQHPLGIGVTMYVDENRIVGILCSGLPLAQLFNHHPPLNGASSEAPTMNDDKVQQVENVVSKFIGRTLLSAEQQAAVSNGHDLDRTGWSKQLEIAAEEILQEIGRAMDSVHPTLDQENNSIANAKIRPSAASSSGNEQTFAQFWAMNKRRYYRHGPASRAAVLDLNEHFTRQLAGRTPSSLAEPLFLTKINTGSRADRLAAAYAHQILLAASGASPRGAAAVTTTTSASSLPPK